MKNFLLPYIHLARLDKPTGIWLLLLPCWWGLFLVKPSALPNALPLKEMLLFAVGAVCLRSAGCTYNDMVDRSFDGRVRRTASRPLAAGTLTLKQATCFLGLQLMAGFLILLCFSPFVIGLGVASLVLVALYPWMKRITWWPQAFLGLTFNWGVLMGCASLMNSLSLAAFCLYAAGIFWTLGYDTLYACQDREDDQLIGVKSSALALGPYIRPFLVITYVFMMIFLILAGFLQKFSWGYYGALLIVGADLAWQVLTVNLQDPDHCRHMFKHSVFTGFLVLLALL